MKHVGHLLKIDENTLSLNMPKYAWVCLEINLSQSLKRGFLVDEEYQWIFIVILYKWFPTFCYACGMIGYALELCYH